VTEVETTRLRLRPPTDEDFEPLHRLEQDVEMMRYMSEGHLHSTDETRNWLMWHAGLWNENGYSLWTAELKETGRYVGWVGVTKPYWFPEMMPTPEVGWFIDRVYWGQGLATEGARAAIEFAFSQLGVSRLIAICNAENKASERVMQKVGMSFWKEVPHPLHGFPVRVYEVKCPTSRT